MSTGRPSILTLPTADTWTSTAMGRFARDAGFQEYPALHRWSVTEPEAFWSKLAEHYDLEWSTEPREVLVIESDMAGARWFPGGELNYAQHALRAAAKDPSRPVVLAHSQTRPPIELTGGELIDQVARCAAGLRRLGIKSGDRVVAYAPNIPEVLIAMLATASLGAVWACCPPEFGTRSALDRLGQLDPHVLLSVDGYRYGQHSVARAAEVAALAAGMSGLRHHIRIPYADHSQAKGARESSWQELLAEPADLDFVPVPFDHPLFVLFSSGSTGAPKAIVHGHGGIIVEHLKALGLHHDLSPSDRFLWFTTTGWMMWNYLVSGLLLGSSVVLFDGNPNYPGPEALLELAAQTATTALGSSPAHLAACRSAGVEPNNPTLRWVGSTGSPLSPELHRWVDAKIGVPVASISGGTDVCTAFLGPSPLVVTRAGELPAALLGCAAEAWDDRGPVPDGTTGELVITVPMPSMPVALWGDDGTRRRAVWFDERPGYWSHGDWVTRHPDGAFVVSGRSDATLNRGGVRLGTAEIYSVLDDHPDVIDSLVIHLDAPGEEGSPGDQLLFFLVVSPGQQVDEEWRRDLKAHMRAELSPRYAPDVVEAVRSIRWWIAGPWPTPGRSTGS